MCCCWWQVQQLFSSVQPTSGPASTSASTAGPPASPPHPSTPGRSGSGRSSKKIDLLMGVGGGVRGSNNSLPKTSAYLHWILLNYIYFFHLTAVFSGLTPPTSRKIGCASPQGTASPKGAGSSSPKGEGVGSASPRGSRGSVHLQTQGKQSYIFNLSYTS